MNNLELKSIVSREPLGQNELPHFVEQALADLMPVSMKCSRLHVYILAHWPSVVVYITDKKELSIEERKELEQGFLVDTGYLKGGGEADFWFDISTNKGD